MFVSFSVYSQDIKHIFVGCSRFYPLSGLLSLPLSLFLHLVRSLCPLFLHQTLFPVSSSFFSSLSSPSICSFACALLYHHFLLVFVVAVAPVISMDLHFYACYTIFVSLMAHFDLVHTYYARNHSPFIWLLFIVVRRFVWLG